ncbi:hypothetical protein P7C71_g6088, partial [Lecanoromycetidae sp. Uapishka_2]
MHFLSFLYISSLPVLVAIFFGSFEAQGACNTAGYVPCPPNDSSGSGGDSSGAAPAVPVLGGGIGDGSVSSADSGPVDSAAMDGIQVGDDSPPKKIKKRDWEELEKRQTTEFCCRPDPVQCLVLDNGLPACYDPSDTRYFFPDDSYYFASNNTFYYANGSSTVLPASTTANSAAGSTQALLGSTAATSASAIVPTTTSTALVKTTNGASTEGATSTPSPTSVATTSPSSVKTGGSGSIRVGAWFTSVLLPMTTVGTFILLGRVL